MGWPIHENNVLNIKDGKVVLATNTYMDNNMTLPNIYKKWERRISYFDTKYNPLSTYDDNQYISHDIIENLNKPITIYNQIIENEKNNSEDLLIVTHGMTITIILSSIYENIIGKSSQDFKFSGGNTCSLIGIEINNNKPSVFYSPSIAHWKNKLK